MFQKPKGKTMDWARAIERNRDALTGIVAALFAMLGLVGDATVARIPRHLHRAVLRVLRPAESAVRRLIVVAARGLVVKPAAARSKPSGRIVGKGKGGGSRRSFQLFDTRKRFAHRRRGSGPRSIPRITTFSVDAWGDPAWSSSSPRPAPKPPDDGHVNAQRLCQRLEALKLALENLPRQARRLVRLRAKREKVPSLALKSPMRPGRPPGYRRKPVHQVDEVLVECHELAWNAIQPDTS
jgi:hypothetical protein